MADSSPPCSVQVSASGGAPQSRWGLPFVLSPLLLHGFFLLYAVNCAVFYRDRMILDTIRLLGSKLLAHGSFFVEHGRPFIQVPPQVLPWIAIHAGLPMKYVALSYSLGFCLYHYVMALVLYYLFRRRDLATLLVLVILVYLVHNNFYILVDGMHIVPWALCMVAVLQCPARAWSGRIAVALGAVAFALATTSSHLFGLPLSLALGGYVFLACEDRVRRLPALAAMAVAVMLYYFWHRAGMNNYEQEKLGQIGLKMLRGNGLAFVRYFAWAHAFAWVGALLLLVLGAWRARCRAVCWFSVLCMLAYALMIASYTPVNEGFIHLYLWHCLLPMYVIMAIPFLDARGAMPAAGVVSRLMFAGALAWAVVGSTSDLLALRERGAFQAHLCAALAEEGKRQFIMEDNQLTRDSARGFARSFLLDETSTRTAYDDPAKATLLITRGHFETPFWAFGTASGEAASRCLPWYPAAKDAFLPAIVPAPRAEIERAASAVSLDWPERPASLRVVDGWLSNYRRPPRLVYNVPVTVANHGGVPLPARDTDGKQVMFGYYWHRDGRILFQDLKAECLPINVKTTFQHAITVQRADIPGDARLAMDLFLNGRPLLFPERYYGLVSGGQGAVRKTQSESVIEMKTGFYNVEKGGVWLAREARFAFNRDLRRCTFELLPPPDVNTGRPTDVEVRCEATGVLITHRFSDRTPFTVVVDTPKAGQTVLVTASRDYCPAREGASADTRNLAVKLSGMKAVAP